MWLFGRFSQGMTTRVERNGYSTDLYFEHRSISADANLKNSRDQSHDFALDIQARRA